MCALDMADVEVQVGCRSDRWEDFR